MSGRLRATAPWPTLHLRHIRCGEIDVVLTELIEDGTWRQTFIDAFGRPPPWTEAELLAVPSIVR